MSRDIDWKETDRLMAELRRQLEEDGAPVGDTAERSQSGTATPETDASVSMTAPTAEEPPSVTVASAAEEDSLQESPVTEAPADGQSVAQSTATNPTDRPSFFVPDEEEEEVAPVTEEAPPTAVGEESEEVAVAEEKPVKRNKKKHHPATYAARTTFEVRPDALDETPIPVPVTHTAETHTAPPTAPSTMSAADEVEFLMRDLFGKGVRPVSEWKQTPAVTTVAPQEEVPEESEPIDLAEQLPEIVTRDADGQLTLVLPDTSQEMGEGGEAPSDDISDPDVGGEDPDLYLTFGGKGRRKRSSAKTPRVVEHESKKPSSEEEDFRFFLELDYEDELGKSIGFDKIRSYHEFYINGEQEEGEEILPKRRKRGQKQEYVHPKQGNHLRKTHANKKRGYVVHLILSLVIMCLLFVYENAGLMASLFKGPLDGMNYPVSYILFGIQLLILAAFFSYRRLIEGFVRLLHFTPIDSSLCSVIFIVTFVYHVVQIFIPHAGYPVLYLSPAAASLALLSLADLLDWYRESLAFQVVSSTKQKYALLSRVSVGGKQNSARERLSVSEQDETLCYVRPVGFVRNYFANTAKRAEHQKRLGWQLLLIAAVGVALALIAFATGDTAEEVCQTFFVTFLLCIPVTSLLVTTLPMFFASALRLKKKSAIVSEEEIYRNDGKIALVLPDTDVFTPMRNERFEVTEGCDEERALSLTRALFELVGSPLADSIDTDPAEDAITLTEIDEHGVSAVFGEEKTPMLFGNVDYLKKYGIEVQPRSNAFEAIARRLLCVAIDGKVEVLFLARYRLSGAMSALLDEMESEKVRVMIRTKDPGLHKDLLEQLLPDRSDPVRVMKPLVHEEDVRTDRVDATIVSLGSATEAAKAYATCRRVGRAGKAGKILQWLSIGFGMALSALLAFFAHSMAIAPILVTLYMLAWCGLHGVISYFTLRERDNS